MDWSHGFVWHHRGFSKRRLVMFGLCKCNHDVIFRWFRQPSQFQRPKRSNKFNRANGVPTCSPKPKLECKHVIPIPSSCRIFVLIPSPPKKKQKKRVSKQKTSCEENTSKGHKSVCSCGGKVVSNLKKKVSLGTHLDGEWFDKCMWL